jgi:hypothetical protein
MSTSNRPPPQRLAVDPINDTTVKNPNGSIFNLSWVKNIKDVQDSVPVSLRGFFQGYIEDQYVHANMYVRSEHTADALRKMLDDGETPVSLNSLRAPTLQLSAAFLASDADKSEYTALQEEVVSAKRRCHRRMIKAKDAEASYYLSSYLNPQPFADGWNACATKAHKHLTAANPGGLPGELRDQCRQWTAMSELYRSNVLELALSLFQKSLHSKEKKRKHRTQEDVVMADAAPNINSRTIASMVDNVLSRRKQSVRDKKSYSGAFAQNIEFCDHPTESLLVNHSQEKTSPHCKGECSEPLQVPQTKKRRKGYQARVREETQVLIQCGTFRMTHSTLNGKGSFTALPLHLPDPFQSFSKEAKLFARLLFTPISLLEKVRAFQPRVHKQEGVHLPRQIEYFLALNIKHCFPISADLSVPMTCFEELAHKARQSWKFQGQTMSTIPGLLAARSGYMEPPGPTFLEEGISEGRKYLLSLIQDFEPTDFRVHPTRLLPGLSCSHLSVRRFMLLNQYMAFITDKNLGIVVTTKDWYEDQILTHLDLDTYRKVSEFPFTRIFDEYQEICSQTWITGFLARFLHESMDHLPPTFHGIPKIHKTPWKIRPIVPMHSYVTARLAKFIQVLLHPLQKSYSWICISSKQFTWKLLRYGRRDKTIGRRLFSGDVRAMYTNIPHKELIASIRNVLQRKSKFPPHVQDFILQAIDFLNQNCYFQFQGQVFQQVAGVAMGLPCGPALANLYLADWEERLNVTERFPFYQRYIDDVFAVDFTADNANSVGAPGLVLDWDESLESSFLDTFVHFHEEGKELCVRPHTKRLNHYQFLPWSSSHPLHVKKGMVKGELIRASYTSAKEAYYLERREAFFGLLRLRGYPDSVLRVWMKDSPYVHPLKGKWFKMEEPADLDAFFVPTKYNPTWSLVKFQEVYNVMLHFWKENNPNPGSELPFPSKAIRSYSRTKSLWDFVRNINKNVLATDSPKQSSIDSDSDSDR